MSMTSMVIMFLVGIPLITFVLVRYAMKEHDDYDGQGSGY
jgi:hypothetical protein